MIDPNNIRKRRVALGLASDAFARIAAVRSETLSIAERGEPAPAIAVTRIVVALEHLEAKASHDAAREAALTAAPISRRAFDHSAKFNPDKRIRESDPPPMFDRFDEHDFDPGDGGRFRLPRPETHVFTRTAGAW